MVQLSDAAQCAPADVCVMSMLCIDVNVIPGYTFNHMVNGNAPDSFLWLCMERPITVSSTQRE